MKKTLAMIMTVVLMTSIFLMGAFSLTTSAETYTVVNVYDAQTLETALTTANADVVLWNDITYSGSAQVVCHSIDLNGYKLIYESQMTLASEGQEFVILDSLYSETAENTGKLEVKKGIYGPTGNVTFESGVISVYGSRGKSGTNGEAGRNAPVNDGTSNGAPGSPGGNGSAGGDGIVVNCFCIQGGEVTISGGAGGTGGAGGSGGNGKNYSTAGHGGYGGAGGNGGDGGSGVVANTVIISNGVVEVNGGHGGDGGDGGTGGNGGDQTSSDRFYYYGGDGGNGGRGGNGEQGGDGIIATAVEISGGVVTISAGNSGAGGSGGYKGYKGFDADKDSKDGANGSIGNDGAGGVGVAADTIVINDGQLSTSGGEAANTSYGGGAGIHGDLTVNGGAVYAYGELNAAGIGGAGNAERKDGSNVKITGGYVFAQGSGNGFDIGGGYYNSVGTPGTLEVTGGTLEFATYGRATNVSSPVFKNCTITGSGAYQHEGTYNVDGKFAVTVDDILIDPLDCVGYDNITVTATVRVSRTTNITAPAPKGYVSFKLDGREFATAPITNGVAVDGMISATATADWIAAEGEHSLTAEYVSGTNDKYGTDGSFSKVFDIAAHTHDWNNEYTVDVQPSCITPGSKSIHCAICDMQKDFAEVDAVGHNYVNNQCDRCQVFLPLVIFKDYDGTVLSSEYYYLGDTVVVPENPVREQNDTYTYTFVGWDKDVSACDGDKVYTAVYESIFREYTIIFKNYDGSELQRGLYHYGELVSGPSEIPKKAEDKRFSYTFAGWDSTVVACNGNKVYTALFNAEYIDYTVTFENDNGTTISRKTYHYGDTVTTPAEPTKASDAVYKYTFNGWNKIVTAVTGDAVYTATYKATYIDYTVTFKNSDGTVLSQRRYHYGDTVTAPAEPTKVADDTYTYTFAGWNTSVVNCKGNATYTATYTSTYIDYVVVFKNWDNSVLSSETYHYGDIVEVPQVPPRDKDSYYIYTFSDWDKQVVKCSGNAEYKATFIATHYHTYVNVGAIAPDCDEDGYTTYMCACSDTYRSDYTDRIGHKYANTCDKICDVCGALRIITHDYANATCTEPMTCTVCGETAGEALGHTYSNACDESCNVCGVTKIVPAHQYTNACDKACNVCGETRVPADHNYNAAICTKPKTCKVCGATSGKALGHDYDAGKVTKAATCKAIGVKTYTCKSCGATKTATIAKTTAHAYSNACDKSCNVCGATRAVGAHKYTNACDKTCNVCGATRSISHTYTSVVTKATLSKDGKIAYKCSVCGYVASTTKVVNRPTSFTLSATSYTYNGSVKTPSVTVKDSAGKTLTKNTDYTVTYADGRKNAGTYKVTVTMKGNYSGTKTLTFKINPINVSKCTTSLSTTTYTYDGKVKSPSVTVKDSAGKTLKKNTDYTVTYASGRKAVGTYKVTVTMKGNYSGTKTLTFKINPPKTTVAKLTPTKTTMTVYVSRKSSTAATGYQIQYATNKSFTDAKTKWITKYSTGSATLTGLKTKTTYFVRVRTYKNVNGKAYYSGWSTIKYVKTK